jgi:serine/threonine protein kinase
MALTAGTKLGPYEILAPLGAGGMGEVYRARDTRLDRSVAIKILPAHLSQNAEAKERFDREARSISSLSYPNICHLYDVASRGYELPALAPPDSVRRAETYARDRIRQY